MQDNITPGTAASLILGINAKIRQHYIYPDIAERICLNLDQHLESGAYEGISEGEFLAYALTTHLQEINHDQHLWVRWHPDPLPEFEGPLYQDPLWMDDQHQAAKSENYGFHKAKILIGNVGYLDIRKFYRLEWGREAAIEALDFQVNSNAIIFDLRRCEGGYSDMVTFFSSHLFSEKAIHLHSIYWRDEDLVQEYWTDADVPGPRLDDLPLYLLTSKDTFSAGEQFASNLKTHQRAVLIGETTAGGANPGASYRLNSHFELFIPIGRAFDPHTNQNWESTGISPDIPAHPDDALKVAHRNALIEIISAAEDADFDRPQNAVLEAKKALENLENS